MGLLNTIHRDLTHLQLELLLHLQSHHVRYYPSPSW